MRKVLLPCDGSAHALRALDVIAKRFESDPTLEIHLLNVRIPVESGHARMFVTREALQDSYRDEGLEALKPAREHLERLGIPYAHHVVVGHVASSIADFARERGLDEIVMGTHGRSALTHLLMGSVATDVLRTTDLPLTLVK